MDKSQLIATLTEGGKDIDILGYMTWWNVKGVELTQELYF